MKKECIRRNNDWKGRIAYEAKKKEEQKQRETFNTKENGKIKK